MNLKTIEYFMVLAEEQNVSKAAERLHISQQALSNYIRRLEEEYRVVLFERKPVFRLSYAGEHMVYYVRQILQAESDMKATFSDIDTNARGILRVGFSRLRGKIFFPLIWKLYHPSHPNISVELIDGNSLYLNEQLLMGKIDLYVGVNVPDNPGTVRSRVANEQMQCLFRADVLRSAFPNSWEKQLSDMQQYGARLSEMADLPFLSLRKGNRLRDAIDQCLPRNIRLNYVFESNDQELVYDCARNGLGIGLISPMVLYEHHRDRDYRQPDLYIVPLRYENPDFTSSLVTPASRQAGYIRDFIDDTELVFRSYAHSLHLR
ncbi:MAG: LysR family transcriptional regulator [Clostridium sp.]|nr:LysR family transcriptional regulator [Clostridium sp.]